MTWFLFAVLAAVASGCATWWAGLFLATQSRGDSVDILLVTFGLACCMAAGVFVFVVLQ